MSNSETERRFDELVTFIRDTIGEHIMPINRETLLEDDLGVSGLDAENLIIEFSKKYEVDISNFRFDSYFYGKPGIFDFINVSSQKIKPFTVGHLEKAILAGRLDDGVIKSL